MRVAFGLEYDGANYVGWQRQKTGVGVQTLVEAAISKVANHPVQSVCAGRTDAGVHASAQVVHVETDVQRAARNWVLGINSNLPNDISVAWATHVNDEFHARFSAIARTYRYVILNQPVRSALANRRAWWVHEPLDESVMQTAAEQLLGRHDFSAYRAAGCQANTPIREIYDMSVTRHEGWISITVKANAYLQHMVRNITGVLVAIGTGAKRSSWAKKVLESRDRTAGGVAAPPHGLTLIAVEYPSQFGIPENSGTDQIRL